MEIPSANDWDSRIFAVRIHPVRRWPLRVVVRFKRGLSRAVAHLVRIGPERSRTPSPGALEPETFLCVLLPVSPVVFVSLPFAFVNEWRRRGLTILLLAAGVGLFANAILILNYSTVINWRYFVTGLPVMAPLAANYLLHVGAGKLRSPRRAFASIAALILVVALTMGLLLRTRIHDYRERLVFAKDYIEQLRILPNDAVVMAGFATVAVTYWRGIRVGQWIHIGTGAGFPAGKLQQTIERHLRAGQRVFFDIDPRWWQPCSWQSADPRTRRNRAPLSLSSGYADNLRDTFAR